MIDNIFDLMRCFVLMIKISILNERTLSFHYAFQIYTSTIKSPSAVQMSKSIKQTQSVDKVYHNTRV